MKRNGIRIKPILHLLITVVTAAFCLVYSAAALSFFDGARAECKALSRRGTETERTASDFVIKNYGKSERTAGDISAENYSQSERMASDISAENYSQSERMASDINKENYGQSERAAGDSVIESNTENGRAPYVKDGNDPAGKYEKKKNEAAGKYEKNGGIDLPILMYHSTFPKDIGQYNIYPSVFEKDLAYLKKNGYTAIDVKDLIDWKNGAFKMPGKSVMITLDDGYLTNYYYAYPLMKKYGMKGVMSVVGSLIDENYRAGSKNTAAHVNYEQIAEMHKSGFMEIQNHTYGLHKNTKDKKGLRKMRGESYKNYKERLSKDLLRLNESLESHTGIRCRAVAFPFGVYSKETVEIIDGLGFKVSFTCAAGINYIQKEGGLHLLKRINRQGGIPTEKFFKQYGME